MDPDQTLIDLLEQLADGDGSGAVGCCEALAEWLDKGGAVPQATAQRARLAITTGEAIDRDDALAKIAKEELGIETLEPRNSDRLDFHDVGVWALRKALRLAWTRGYEHAQGGRGRPIAARVSGGTRVLNTQDGEAGIIRNGFTYEPERGWIEYEVETGAGVERWLRDHFVLFSEIEASAASDETAAAAKEPPPPRAVCPRCGTDFTIHKID